MEASEKPQLPLDPGELGPGCEALEDRLVIERLEVIDELAARVVRDQAAQKRAPAETVRKAIEIGTRVIDSEGTAANVDFVQAEFERALARPATEALESARVGQRGARSRNLRPRSGRDRSDSVQQQIREMLIKANEHQRTELVRLFNAEEGTNPLADFKTAVTAEGRQKRFSAPSGSPRRSGSRSRPTLEGATSCSPRSKRTGRGGERIAEAEEAGTRKGRSFEDLVHGELEPLAESHDDAAHHVGDTSSEAGGKMGDTVIEVGACSGPAQATIVFEAKNRKLSKNDAWTELNGAMQERDAAYAVLVVAGEDKIPSGLRELTEYQGNKMIVVLDREEPDPLALRLVYRYVRARTLAATAGSFEVDAAGVRAATEEAQSKLKTVNRIRKSLTSITTSADRAREDVDGMVADVETCLVRVESLIEVAEEDK